MFCKEEILLSAMKGVFAIKNEHFSLVKALWNFYAALKNSLTSPLKQTVPFYSTLKGNQKGRVMVIITFYNCWI